MTPFVRPLGGMARHLMSLGERIRAREIAVRLGSAGERIDRYGGASDAVGYVALR
ncbi:MAG: hypothetical protein OXD42_11990 [Rhodospirillaceae bacterium]|nr:hypothetical protein [Rhodospirillaceae bacterium]MCY4239022.1 hypothetical protein [Rhodospirillaceae bacterium]